MNNIELMTSEIGSIKKSTLLKVKFSERAAMQKEKLSYEY